MKLLFGSVVVLLVGTYGFGQSAEPSDADYAKCLESNLLKVENESQERIVRDLCRRKHPSQWVSDGIRNVITGPTLNNDGVGVHGGCASSSPEGKYCADIVSAEYKIEDDDDERFEYRIAEFGDTCPPMVVSSGPGAWHQQIGCTVTSDRKEFVGKVKGWTQPQTFTFMVPIERRYR